MRARPVVAAALILTLSACSAQGPLPDAGGAPGMRLTPAPSGGGEPSAPASTGPGPEGTAAQASAGAADPAPAPPAALHLDPTAPDVVVNKQRPVQPATFAPSDLRRPDAPASGPAVVLRPDAAAAVERMFAGAREDGVGLVLVSGYRSYTEQDSTYRHWLEHYGNSADADVVSARPGYSEHQTGLAFDIAQADGACTLVACFAQTAAAIWAAEHAAEYGIILRYPLGFHDVTGFFAEPWHLRYVGEEVALGMKETGRRTLEEYFGLPSAPSY